MDVPVLLLEFEGVLADTAAIRRDALRESLAVESLFPSDDVIAPVLGYTTEEAVRRLRRTCGAIDDETAVELGRLRAERAFAARAGKGIAVQPRVRETLESLASHARVALVTRASRREVEFVLDLAGIAGVLRPIIAVEDVSPSKPSRAPWLAALARIAQLFPGQTLKPLAIEDHLVGVRAAREAGIPVVAVGAFEPHEAVEADAWVEQFADLTVERVRALSGVAAGGRR